MRVCSPPKGGFALAERYLNVASDEARHADRPASSAVSDGVFEAARYSVRAPAALVIVPCSARKSVAATPDSRAVSLPRAPQSVLETAWLRVASALNPVVAARDLYDGRGFSTVALAATRSGCELMVVSAGLGLVSSGRRVPSYGLTLAGTAGPDAVRGRVAERFDSASWWRAVQSGPYATAFADAFPAEGLVAMALSQPYARMVSGELASLDDGRLNRLRIVGAALAPHLPERVARASLLPYDSRLDRLVPGVRGEFAHRALVHFLELVRETISAPDGDIVVHRALVWAALGKDSGPATAARPRATDQAIADRIAARMPATPPGRGAAAMLRALRHEDGIACEASRFSRIYRRVAGTP